MGVSLSSDAKGKKVMNSDNDDWISPLPQELLVKILTNLSTEDAVKTSALSKRWKHVWKQIPYLYLNMDLSTINTGEYFGVQTNRHVLDDELVTKVINNHHGYLKGCSIRLYTHRYKSGVIESWIQKLIHEKHAKALSLLNLSPSYMTYNLPQYSSNIFSHPNLESLFLFHYTLKVAHAFNNCHNLKVLKLETIFAEVDVVNTVIASCSSLKVLVLHVIWYNNNTCLKIHNNNLKVLHLHSSEVDSIDVFAPLLDIFSIRYSFHGEHNLVIKAPRILFNSWVKDMKRGYMIYNISSYAEEKEHLGHEFLDATYSRLLGYLEVVLDVTNSKEVEMLRQILIQWHGVMRELHILFKDNNVSKEECESSIGEPQKNKWGKTNLFPFGDFLVKTVWMYNFSGSKKQFALASRFVTQGIVVEKMMIKASSMILANKKLDTDAALAKLMELPKGNEMLSIGYF